MPLPLAFWLTSAYRPAAWPMAENLVSLLPQSRAEVRPTTQCWWFQCPLQTRDHLFKVFFLFIHIRVRPIYIMTAYIFARFSSPQSARWRLVARSPLPSAQACSKKE